MKAILITASVLLLAVYTSADKKKPNVVYVPSENIEVLDPVVITATRLYPKHWGNPPLKQTRDRKPLPAPFKGWGSSTLVKWILKNQKADKEL